MTTRSNRVGVQHYATRLGSYDEMQVGPEDALPHWQKLLAALVRLGPKGLERCHREAGRLLRENGVTYNTYDDPQGVLRPWQLDPVPLLVSRDEWQQIEAGLTQRAELLNLILADLYGEQKLLRQGLLPLELIYAHAGFQRAAVGARFPGERPLVLYAANLARGPEGRMWVVDDRTQAPSGAGYALENRTVMTRILPGLMREFQAHRLGGFFRSLRSGLAQIAPHNRDDPRVVVLTSGPLNETYFEHAYLASFLGYPLAQGDDLLVRDGRVWLKSLEGLQQIDVILRRLDDAYCDPLELRSDSLLGVPGLMEAARRGHVAIANPVGSSILENPALLPFLPGISRQLLGEELRLPSVATWWCGQPHERDFVLENLDKLVIKPIHRTPRRYAIFGSTLDKRGLELWRAHIRAKPHMYVGQEEVGFSTIPSLDEGEIVSRHAILRTFVVAGEQGYRAMPGGLARIAPRQDDLSVSEHEGGVSKDTWVLATPEEVRESRFAAAGQGGAARPLTGPLPSRAADNLFWVGRYAERAEGTARLIRTLLAKLGEELEFDAPTDTVVLNALLQGLTHMTCTYPGFVGKGGAGRLAKPQGEIMSLLLNPQKVGSLPDTLQAFGRSAFTVRDLWSSDAWHVVDDIQQEWRQARGYCQIESSGPCQDYLDQLLIRLVAFSGLTSESMAHDPGWLLLEIGRRLERGLTTISLLRATVVAAWHDAAAAQIIEAVLASTESLMTFRRRYRSSHTLEALIELLVLDEKHPRALAYQLRKLRNHINALPQSDAGARLSPSGKIILDAYTMVQLSDSEKLVVHVDEDGDYAALERLLSTVWERLFQLSEALTQTYFSHAQGPRQMAPTRREEEL
ncbi:MAG: hypothetical protein C0621_08075 [Desulfuromonas sp.]|nr:MAG: hypothetical protein C0621_08075 [Desulfuromonas sp.]